VSWGGVVRFLGGVVGWVLGWWLLGRGLVLLYNPVSKTRFCVENPGGCVEKCCQYTYIKLSDGLPQLDYTVLSPSNHANTRILNIKFSIAFFDTPSPRGFRVVFSLYTVI